MAKGKGLAMLIVGKGKPSYKEGSPSEEASEPSAEAGDEGDSDYTALAGEIISAVKSDDTAALATALKALCGMSGGGE